MIHPWLPLILCPVTQSYKNFTPWSFKETLLLLIREFKKGNPIVPGKYIVDIPLGKLLFIFTNGQVVQKLRLVQGKQKLSATCPRDELELKLFQAL